MLIETATVNKTRKTREEARDLSRASFALDVVKTVFTVIGAFSLVIAVEREHKENAQTQDAYLQKKRDATLTFLQIFDRDTGAPRQTIESGVRMLSGGKPVDELQSDLAGEIWHADAAWKFESGYLHKLTDRERVLWDVRNAMISLLNHLESIAVANQKDSLDPQIVEASLKPVMIEWRRRLKPFTEVVDRDKLTRGQGAWEPFYQVTDKWQAEKTYHIPEKPSAEFSPRWPTRQ